MNKKSRLRVNDRQRLRRGVLYFLLLAVAGVAVWQLDRTYRVVAFIREMIGAATRIETGAAFSRGTIYDRNLKQIAVTLDRVLVYARTQEIKSIPDTVKVLSEILSLDEKELQSKLEGESLRVWLAEDISLEQEIAIKSKRLAGVYLQKEEKRFYPNGSQAAHLIGYAEDGIGLAGIEYYYDRLQASRQSTKNGQVHLNSEHDLLITLDFKIQDILDGLVGDIAKQQNAHQVIAYIMEGRTGEIIGGSQLPEFDPNNFTKYSQEVLRNRFVAPVLLPVKFRSFLRDLALLHGQDNQETAKIPWSLRPNEGNLGSQLRLWDWLGLNDKPLADFHMTMQPGETLASDQKPMRPPGPFLEMVPEYATPFNILTALAVLKNDGKPVRPFAVKRSVDERVDNVPGERVDDTRAPETKFFQFQDGLELFKSLARPGAAQSLFFHDEIPAMALRGTSWQVFINELLLVTIPAGGNDLHLLVMVEREPEGPNLKNGKKVMTLEQLVEEKVARISILQQVAKTVADVVEPEVIDDGNYQRAKDQPESSPGDGPEEKTQQHAIDMPDLKGLSLRKSLRLLQGVHMKISIRGTGKVISQKPAPGTSLKGVNECTIILEKGEDVVPEKLSKGDLTKK